VSGDPNENSVPQANAVDFRETPTIRKQDGPFVAGLNPQDEEALSGRPNGDGFSTKRRVQGNVSTWVDVAFDIVIAEDPLDVVEREFAPSLGALMLLVLHRLPKGASLQFPVVPHRIVQPAQIAVLCVLARMFPKPSEHGIQVGRDWGPADGCEKLQHGNYLTVQGGQRKTRSPTSPSRMSAIFPSITVLIVFVVDGRRRQLA
jgi:hypothetical protein